MYRKITSILLVLAVLAVWPQLAVSKMRQAINFEDNTFIEMDKTELLHRYRKIDGYADNDYELTRLNYRLAYGILPNFEAGLNLPVIFSETGGGEQGLGDLEVYQKFKFLEPEGGLPAASGGFGLVLPTAERVGAPFLGTDGLDARFFLTLGRKFNAKLSWLLNLAMRFSGDTDYKDQYNYNGALTYRLGSRAGWVLEVNGKSGGMRDKSEVYGAPGLLLQPKESLTVNITLPVGLNDNSADYKTAAQFSVDF